MDDVTPIVLPKENSGSARNLGSAYALMLPVAAMVAITSIRKPLCERMALARISEIGTVLAMDVSTLFALPLYRFMYAIEVKPNEKKYAPMRKYFVRLTI